MVNYICKSHNVTCTAGERAAANISMIANKVREGIYRRWDNSRHGPHSLVSWPVPFQLHKEHGGPGISSHLRDIKHRKVVERT